MKGKGTIAAGVAAVLAFSACSRSAPPAAGSAFEIPPYLQALTGTSVEVRWQGRGAAPGRVEWGTAPGRLDRYQAASVHREEVTVAGATPDEPAAGRTVYLQRARLTGLEPGTAYYYRVRQGGSVTEVLRFRTPPRRPRRFRFIVYGDTRTFPADHRRVARAMRRENPDFIIHTGDLVSRGDNWPEWSSEFFRPLYPLSAEVPVRPVRGNHDGSRRTLTKIFHFPGAPERVYYRFDYGRARFIVLDGTLWKSRPAMLAWLEEQLRARPKPAWTFLFCHYPPFSSTAKRGYGRGWERERLAYLCQRYGVDIVFAGHDHNYMRTVPVLAYRAMKGGPTTHVVTGGGGAPLYSPAHATYIQTIAKVHHFCRVDIDGNTLALRTVSADTGGAIDGFSLVKDTDGRVVLPVDYRRQARELAEINALEALRRGLTAFTLKPIDAGDTVPLERTVDNAFPGPVEVTVRFVGSSSRWVIPPPVGMTLPARSVEIPFGMVLTARRAMEDEYDVGHLEVDYRLWDGRRGTLRGEGIRVGKRRAGGGRP